MTKIEEYIGLFPEEIRDALKALSEDTRLAIMINLMMYPQGKTFTELMSDIEVSQGILNNHLKNLLENGLIKNEYRKVEERRDYSFYLSTIMGNKFMQCLLEVMEKPINLSIGEQSIIREQIKSIERGRSTIFMTVPPKESKIISTPEMTISAAYSISYSPAKSKSVGKTNKLKGVIYD